MSETTERDAAEAEGEETTQAAPEAETKTPDDVQAALDDLKAQLADEKAKRQADVVARQAAEQEAQRQRDAATQSHVSARQANLTAVARALDAANASMVGLQGEYAAALQAGEFSKSAEVQAKIAESAARKVQLEAAKQQLEAMPEERPQQVPSDPFEAALTRYTPRTQSWIRQHPDVLRDQQSANLAIAAHHTALAAGHIPDTDAYFDALERALGYKKDEAPAQTQRRQPVAAPPSRSGSMNGGAKSNKVDVRDMTPRMVELAEMAGLKPEEWLKHYNDAVERGEIQRLH